MEFTKGELKRISAEGSFLKERLEGKTIFSDSGIAEKRFELWKKKAGGSGGENSFIKRLKVDGITLEKAREVSKEAAWNDQFELPGWSEAVNALIQVLPADREKLKGKLLFRLEEYLKALKEHTQQNEKVFVEVKENMLSLVPFIYYAEQQLIRKLGDRIELFSGAALSDMSEVLAKGLYQMVYKTISEKLRIFILRKESFGFLMNLKDEDRMKYMALYSQELTAGGWKDVFLEYPVLPRIMTTVIHNWVNHMNEFSAYLRDDIKVLEIELNGKRKLGSVKSVKGSISDSHNKGRGVLIAVFESGTKIVYKPRDFGIDNAYEKLACALKETGFPLELKAPKALQFKDHGWIEFIEYKAMDSPDEAKSFYRRAGALLCLVYALGGNDFHGENMIASGAHPVLIDLETIISYKMIQFNEAYEDLKEVQDFVDLLQESVLGLGFLPIWIAASNNVLIDFGALTGNVATSFPSFDDKPVKVFEYKRELLEGFGEAYDFLVKKGSRFFEDMVRPLFGEVFLRVIIRPTNVYVKMLYHTLSPELLKDGFLYSIEMERFAPAYLNRVEEDKARKLWRMFLYERDALEERDIPIFYGHAKERSIKNSDGSLCEDYFMDSVMERICKKLSKMDARDKKRQMDFISESLSIYHKGCHHEGDILEWHFNPLKKPISENSMPKQEKLLCEAKEIYDGIMSKAVKIGDESISWVSYQYDLINNRTMIGQTTASLYDGVFGISVFASALYALTGDEDVKKNALFMIKPFRKSLRDETYKMPVYRMPPGLGKGLGGILKSLILIGDYTGEKSLY